MPKMRRFTLFLAITAAIAAGLSTVAWFTVFRVDKGEALVIALVAPLSGPDAPQGAAILAGAEQWLARQPAVRGRPLVLRPLDSHARPDALAAAAAQHDVLAVLSAEGTAAEEDTLARLGLPRVLLAGQPVRAEAWSFALSADRLAAALNGSLVATPLLLDTAGVEAQAFEATFRATRDATPDWLAVLGHDGARAIAQALAQFDAPAAAEGRVRWARWHWTMRWRIPASRSSKRWIP